MATEGNEPGNLSSGRILTGQELVAALSGGGEIFRDGSWSPKQIRGAGYDLRLAADMMVIPKTPENSEYLTVGEGETIIERFTLAPGDTALVSTVEQFSMEPWIAAQVSAKFGLAAKGVLLLSGTAIHPGYGRTKPRTEGGIWEPRDNERLYLVMANVGPVEVNFRCNDTIAHLQFFELDRDGLVAEERNVSFDYLRRNLFSEGLAYFKNVRDLTRKVDDERRESVAEIAELKREAAALRTLVDRVQSATNTVVVFGVYLIGVTLLGFAVATISSQIINLPRDLSATRIALVASILTLYAATSIAGVVAVTLSGRRSTHGRSERCGSS